MKIILANDPFDPSTWTEHESVSLFDWLTAQFSVFPDNARIYHRSVASENDVTPGDENDIERLSKLDGTFYVVLYPNGIEWIIIGVIALVALAAIAFTLLSSPNIAANNNQSQSPNNSLSDRQNTARPKQRIPDIFGTVRSTPDLLQVPYRIFDATGDEFEIWYGCISRGELDVSDIRDGDTLISEIFGESVEVYGPNTSPNSGDAPQITIGDPIATQVVSVTKSIGVNGQTLYSPNYKALDASDAAVVYFEYPNKMRSSDVSQTRFGKRFDVGDICNITTVTYTDGGNHANLTGVGYIIATVTPDTITFTNAAAVTTDWNNLSAFTASRTAVGTPLVDGLGLTTRWVGPVIIDDPDLTGAILNFVALNGLYNTDGTDAQAFPVSLTVGITPVDSFGANTGPEVQTTVTLPGSASRLTQQALTSTLALSGRSSVRVMRTTRTNYVYAGTIADEVKWRDLYGTAPIGVTDFGNVTTIQALTRATQASLGLKERKITLLATRKVPVRIGSTSTFGANTATDDIAPIISAMALDPFIGNRDISEIDVSNIYDTSAAIAVYFGNDAMAQFGYTFDASNMTFEETIAAVAGAAFCTAYRRGNQIKLSFEKLNPDSSLLFNHRNKMPGSETRTTRFGNQDNVDGIEYRYVDPANMDAIVSIYRPEGNTALNAKVIDSIGVRNWDQANYQAYRLWNKLQYQNLQTDFVGTQEADLLIRTDRILVTNDVKPGTQAGEILTQDVLTLGLSQPFSYSVLDHTIFLQLSDGTVQPIAIASADPSPARFITLAEPPSLALALDDGLRARTVYEIVGNSGEPSAFLVDTKVSQERFKTQVTAINYDERYYLQDTLDELDFGIEKTSPWIAVLFEDF